MKVYGEFEIHDTFKITDHGIILTGKIISKKNNIRINIGNKLSFKYNGEKIIRNIKGFESGFDRNLKTELSHLQNIGIMIKCESDIELESMNKWQPNKVIAELLVEI